MPSGCSVDRLLETAERASLLLELLELLELLDRAVRQAGDLHHD